METLAGQYAHALDFLLQRIEDPAERGNALIHAKRFFSPEMFREGAASPAASHTQRHREWMHAQFSQTNHPKMTFDQMHGLLDHYWDLSLMKVPGQPITF